MCALLLSTLGGLLPTQAAAEQSPVDRIWQDLKGAFVKIEVNGRDLSGTPRRPAFGTGIIVSTKGDIVTSLHVVGESWFRNPDGTLDRSVTVYGLDDQGRVRPLGDASVTPVIGLDIAILAINGDSPVHAVVAQSRPKGLDRVVVVPWDPMLAVPGPVGASLTVTDRAKYGDRLTVNVSLIEGNSGSPVLSETGELIGIVTNIIDGKRAVAVPAELFERSLPNAGGGGRSLAGRWCGAFDSNGITEVMEIAQSGAVLSGSSYLADRFGNVKGERSSVQGTISQEGRITLTLIREEGRRERYTLVGRADKSGGSIQVSFGGTSQATYYTRPCLGFRLPAKIEGQPKVQGAAP